MTEKTQGSNVRQIAKASPHKPSQAQLSIQDEVEKHLPKNVTVVATKEEEQLWDPKGRIVTICANVASMTGAVCDWDIALTLSGAYVYTPCHTLIEGYGDTELGLADFAQNIKIGQADCVLLITNRMGSIDDFMIPWIMHAFNSGKEVYSNTSLVREKDDSLTNGEETVVAMIRVNVLALLRPHYLYPLSREHFESHIRLKQIDALSVNDSKLIE
jgi:hypothetical protein